MQIIFLLLGIGALVVASFTVPAFLLWKRHPNSQDSASIFGWLIVQYALLAALVWGIQEIPLTLEQALAMATIPWLRRIINFFLPDRPWTWELPKSERLRATQSELTLESSAAADVDSFAFDDQGEVLVADLEYRKVLTDLASRLKSFSSTSEKFLQEEIGLGDAGIRK